MYHLMFDVDGTLTQSSEVDAECFCIAVEQVLGVTLSDDWAAFDHATDSGILRQILHESNAVDTEACYASVKETFLRLLKRRLDQEPVKEVPQANRFLKRLRAIDNVTVSLATGCWYDSCALKLASAGIDVDGIAIASADDHFARKDIMEISRQKIDPNRVLNCTYFGDAPWDLQASNDCGVNFVLVGNRLSYKPNILTYQEGEEILRLLGIEN